MNLLPICVAVVIVAAICLLACLLGDDTATVQTEPDQPHHTCHIRGCGRIATGPKVIRRDTGTHEPVCNGCRDQGRVLGYWTNEVAS